MSLPSQFDRTILHGTLIAGLVAAPIVLVLLVLLVANVISAPEMIFYMAAAVVLFGALGAVLVRNVVHAALCLVATLLGVAGIYLLLLSEFLALVQVLVYGGGVVILLLFGLMLTNAQADPVVTDGSQRPFAYGVGAIIAGAFVAAMVFAQWNASPPIVHPLSIFGERLFRDFSVPVIIVAVLLDIAFTGAFVNARRPAEPSEETAR
jgi:NADH-quinone oxidoreductase subunit J